MRTSARYPVCVGDDSIVLSHHDGTGERGSCRADLSSKLNLTVIEDLASALGRRLRIWVHVHGGVRVG